MSHQSLLVAFQKSAKNLNKQDESSWTKFPFFPQVECDERVHAIRMAGHEVSRLNFGITSIHGKHGKVEQIDYELMTCIV